MIHKIYRTTLIFALALLTLTSCEDDDYGIYYSSVEFERTGLFVQNCGESQSTTFKLDNVAYLEINEAPDGWDVVLDFYKGIITVTAPDEITTDEDGETNDFGEISIIGENHDGYSVNEILEVGIVEFVHIEDQANSMIVTEPKKLYIFNPTYKGEDITQTISGIESCELVWRSYPGKSIKHVQMLSPTEMAFYVAHDEYDSDEDDDYTDVLPCNAVVAALDSSEDILWSWHIWICESEPEEVQFNGKTFMSRNLGASMNEIDTLYAYGLYYQWGRKDPFNRPSYYEATRGFDGFMMDSDDNTVSIEYEESTSTIGKVSYAIENPLTYILGISDSNYDWLYSAHDSDLWSDDKKSIYDPSPKGWRVPRSTDFEGVEISYYPVSTEYSYPYAAYLKDSYGNEELFMGFGRRNYLTGRISNTNTNGTPWSGYYWTSGSTSANTKSTSFIFSNLNYIENGYSIQRANGLQIRCVKDE